MNDGSSSVLWVSDNGRWKVCLADGDQLVVTQETGAAVTVWRPRFRSPLGKGGKRTSHKIDWGRTDVLPPVPYVERKVRDSLSWLESR